MNENLSSLAARPERELNLVQAAFLIAREEYPELDIPLQFRRFIELSEKARTYVAGLDLRAVEAVARMNEFFFGYCGFRGNSEDYDDPRNSCLNDVMDRKLGLPITLALLYVEIGRRIGMAPFGIGFPGRYLVGFAGLAGVYVDCFEGRTIDRDGCQRLLDELTRGRSRVSPEMLRESTPKETIARMLTNLRTSFTRRGPLLKAVRFTELAALFQPDRADLYRERGLLKLRSEAYGQAVADLEEYLRRAPDAPDAPQVVRQLEIARKLLTRNN